MAALPHPLLLLVNRINKGFAIIDFVIIVYVLFFIFLF